MTPEQARRAVSDHAHRRPGGRGVAAGRRQGQSRRHHPGAGPGRAQRRRAHLREDARSRRSTPRTARVTGVQTDARAPSTAEIVVNCARPVGARSSARTVGVTVPLYSCEHMYIVTEPMEGVPRDLPVMRDPDGYIYFKEEVGGLLMGGFEPEAKPWEQGRHPRRLRVRHAAGRLGPVPDPDGQRADPRAGAGEDRHQDLHERARELHARPQLHPGRGAARCKASSSARASTRWASRARGGAGMALAEWIVGRRADARSLAGRHPPLRALPRQRRLAARPRRRDARPALQDAVAATASWRARRPFRRSPLYDRLQARGACFGTKMGWERANWFAGAGETPDIAVRAGAAELVRRRRRRASGRARGRGRRSTRPRSASSCCRAATPRRCCSGSAPTTSPCRSAAPSTPAC